MKRLNLLFSVLAVTMVLIACDSSKDVPVISSDPGSPSLVSPQQGASFTLNEAEAEDTLMVLEWNEPDFGFSAAPTYRVRMHLQNIDSDTVELGTTNQTRFPLIVGELNNLLLTLGAIPEQENPASFTIIAELGENASKRTFQSEGTTVNLIPFRIEIEVPQIFVPGDFQEAAFYGSNWTPADAPPLASANSDNIFQGFVYFGSANTEFKLTEERDWDVNWGDDGADGTLDLNGANIVEEEAGYQLITVNLNDDTFDVTKTDWGIIGSATVNDWDSDLDMTYVPEEKVWRVTLDLTAEEIKFRANDAWDINFGDDGGDGILDFGGANIPISEEEAGNGVTVELDLSNPPQFTYKIISN